MLTIEGIVGVSRAILGNRDALPKFYHNVYRHTEVSEDTLDIQLVSEDLGLRMDMQTLSLFVIFDA